MLYVVYFYVYVKEVTIGLLFYPGNSNVVLFTQWRGSNEWNEWIAYIWHVPILYSKIGNKKIPITGVLYNIWIFFPSADIIW